MGIRKRAGRQRAWYQRQGSSDGVLLATGSQTASMTHVFDGPDDKDTAVLRRVAKFSLGANLQRHKKLVELIQKHRKERGPGSEKALGELILEFKG